MSAKTDHSRQHHLMLFRWILGLARQDIVELLPSRVDGERETEQTVNKLCNTVQLLKMFQT